MNAKIFTLEALPMTPTVELHAQPQPLHATAPRLDRAKWHTPLISIVMTHFNYSHHVRDALLSIVDQTYENWECIVIDDCSTSHHRVKLAEIIHEIGCDKIRLLCLDRNEGQIPAFFHGLDETSGDFVCLLDPDDRYAQTFLEESIAAHLCNEIYCPIVCTEQMLMTARGLLTGTYHGLNVQQQSALPTTSYIAAKRTGWHWTSTSSMMFRRGALKLVRPHKKLAYRGSADSFLAQGCHLLGGTLFLHEPLVYRQVHASNAWLCEDIFATAQNKARTYGEERTRECMVDVREAIEANGGAKFLPTVKEKPGTIARLSRSFRKRLDWLMSELAQGPQR